MKIYDFEKGRLDGKKPQELMQAQLRMMSFALDDEDGSMAALALGEGITNPVDAMIFFLTSHREKFEKALKMRDLVGRFERPNANREKLNAVVQKCAAAAMTGLIIKNPEPQIDVQLLAQDAMKIAKTMTKYLVLEKAV